MSSVIPNVNSLNKVEEGLITEITKINSKIKKQLVESIIKILNKYPNILHLFIKLHPELSINNDRVVEINGGGYYKGGGGDEIISGFSILLIMLMMGLAMSKKISIIIKEKGQTLNLNEPYEDDIPLVRDLEQIDTDVYNYSLLLGPMLKTMESSSVSFANALDIHGWMSFSVRFAVLISILYEAYKTKGGKTKTCEIEELESKDNSETISEIIVLIMGFLSVDIEGVTSGFVDNSNMNIKAGLIIKGAVIWFSNTHLAPLIQIAIKHHADPKSIVSKFSTYIHSERVNTLMAQHKFGGRLQKKSKKRRKTNKKYKNRRTNKNKRIL